MLINFVHDVKIIKTQGFIQLIQCLNETFIAAKNLKLLHIHITFQSLWNSPKIVWRFAPWLVLSTYFLLIRWIFLHTSHVGVIIWIEFRHAIYQVWKSLKMCLYPWKICACTKCLFSTIINVCLSQSNDFQTKKYWLNCTFSAVKILWKSIVFLFKGSLPEIHHFN